MLTPECYVGVAKDLYDCGYPADECPPYMVIYETLRTICENQQEILENQKDVDVLLSVLSALPQLREIEMDFCQSIDEPQWVDSYLSFGTAKEVSNILHIRTVTKALQRRSGCTAPLVTIGLSSLEPPHYHFWELPKFPSLSGALELLLKHCTTLRITGNGAALELLARSTVKIRQLILGPINISYIAWQEFLKSNRQTIVSIGFYHTYLVRGSGEILEFSPKLLSDVLPGVAFTTRKSTDHWKMPYWETGWIIQLGS
ncbi:hypothetical protein ASPCAL07436 [Aspergillus calidoustus]|uniref:Uncharacterized protein n=1 Tax=Aspergillus calidoustus TaxID=454130 RepID=A0A0U5CAP2_ASPCI|nr:hypothetical protein ASPCAL07436 [Aspergillus calidoustus]